jgi:hypothetical protein
MIGMSTSTAPPRSGRKVVRRRAQPTLGRAYEIVLAEMPIELRPLIIRYVDNMREPKRVKNRVHLDLVNPDPAAVDELVRLGATVIGKHQVPGQLWTVMQDPEGNEFCIAAKSFTGWD